MASSIDGGCLQNGLRRVREEAHQEDQIVDGHAIIEDHGPDVIQQAQPFHHKILLDDTRLENHHHDEEGHEQLLARQIGPGEGVSGHGGDHYVEGYADDGDEQAVEQGPPNGGVREDDLIVDEGEAGGDDTPAGHARHLSGVGKGLGHQVEHGDQNDDQDKDHHRVDYDSGGKRKPPFFSVCHELPGPLPVNFLAVKWVTKIRARLMMLLNREAAVAKEYWVPSRPMR